MSCDAVTVMVAGLALAGIACWPAGAWAQSPDAPHREVPIGTFNLGTPPQEGVSVQEPPVGMPEARQPGDEEQNGSWLFQSWGGSAPGEESVAALLAEAKAALAAGRVADAQRLLERVVAENPDSTFASEARQHLGQLYRTAAGGEDRVERTGDASDATLPWSKREAVPRSQGGAEVAITPAAILRARASGVLDEQFLSEAGDRVFFSGGSAELGVRARGVIQAQARFLAHHPELSAAIEGHADDGAMSEEETMRLSEARAAAVRDRLVAEGVDGERLVVLARGRQDRVSDCPSAQCLAQNRRAITILLTGIPGGDNETGAVRRAQGGGFEQPSSPATQ
jgi:peptidoglycan-associated lipoprotein